MKVEETSLPGVLLIRTRMFPDTRGNFRESWSDDRYRAAGIDVRFVQDNISVSKRGVIRGLHFQNPHGQAKLVSVLQGAVWDVSVDVRAQSPTFGRWVGAELCGEVGTQLFVPAGFAHGFAVLSETAIVAYKCSEYYAPHAEHTLRWDDPVVRIEWPISEPILSDKDRAGQSLNSIPEHALPEYHPL